MLKDPLEDALPEVVCVCVYKSKIDEKGFFFCLEIGLSRNPFVLIPVVYRK